MEWKFQGGGWLQVYQAPDRAGKGSCTLSVDDLAGEVLSGALDSVTAPRWGERVRARSTNAAHVVFPYGGLAWAGSRLQGAAHPGGPARMHGAEHLTL